MSAPTDPASPQAVPAIDDQNWDDPWADEEIPEDTAPAPGLTFSPLPAPVWRPPWWPPWSPAVPPLHRVVPCLIFGIDNPSPRLVE